MLLTLRLRSRLLACSQALCVASLLLAGVSLPGAASARVAEVYAGTWGPAAANQGRVYRYEYGTTWTEISPPGGLADAVWDLEWAGGELWAATHDGPAAHFSMLAHGTAGHAFSYDGVAWQDRSPPGGFGSAVTTVTVLEGIVHVTVDQDGLYRHDGGTSWTLLDSFIQAGQAIVSSTHSGTPLLYMGQDEIDEFWVYDPSATLACGTPVNVGCHVPPNGVVCTADCHFGSCIHAFAEFDAGGPDGSLVYAGAFFGRTYRWDRAARLFVPLPNIPEPTALDFTRQNIHGLASYDDRLWAGFASGRLWSSADASAGSWTIEHDFGDPDPISEMLVVPEDDLLWLGFGGVPYRWSRDTGNSAVRTWDGTTFVDRSVPGQFGGGVLALLAAVPPVECVPAVSATHECDAVPAPSNPFTLPACLVGPATITFGGEERVDGDCEDRYALTRTWNLVNPCGVDRTFLECLEVVDTTPPAILGVQPNETLACPAVPADPAVSAADNCDPAPVLDFDELHVDGPCVDSYSLQRSWTATDRCGNVSDASQLVSVADLEPPVPFAVFEPLAPVPPASAASPLPPTSALPPTSPASACSASSIAAFRITCGAVDDCDPLPSVTASLRLTRHVIQPDGSCLSEVEVLPVACGDELILELLAAPCDALSPTSAQSPSSAAPPVGVTSEGVLIARGELIELEVQAVDRCGNSATATFDPTPPPAGPCDDPLPDGTCCPAIASPAAVLPQQQEAPGRTLPRDQALRLRGPARR